MRYQGKLYTLVIFDVDHTLTVPKSGATFRKSVDDWQWIPGRLERLREIGRDTHIGIATNQGGVAFGYFTSSAILFELGKMCGDVPISTKGLQVCYTHPTASIDAWRDENDERRKPGPGMLREVAEAFMLPVNPARVLMVGDRSEDQGAAHAFGCDFAYADVFFATEEASPREEQGG